VHLISTAREGSWYLSDWTLEIYVVKGSIRLNVDGPLSGLLLLLKKKKKKGEEEEG
jgi:hypothetical protein